MERKWHAFPPLFHVPLTCFSPFCSKMAHLIYYLRDLCKNPDARVIIFSQWDRMLRRVADTLQENGINNVCCKGNVHQRNKAIDSFKSKQNCQVIMVPYYYLLIT